MPLRELVSVALGERPADLLLRGGTVVNVLTQESYRADVAIVGDRIAGVGSYSEAKATLDLDGALLMPGFIDGHVHIESSLCTPSQFARVVLPHGTTTVIADAHEIANVCGRPGLEFMLTDSLHSPLEVFFTVPSCVPASPFETSGAEFNHHDLEELLKLDRVVGMGEMMNFPGVIARDEKVIRKMALKVAVKDGHSPGLTGRELNAYLAAGISSDHECLNVDEAREKLRLGAFLMIREGSLAKNLVDLIGAVTTGSADRCMFVTDDRHCDDLLAHGHMDHAIRLAIGAGMDPLVAIKLSSINCARYFGLERVGAIAPGWQADLAIASSWSDFKVQAVVKKGVILASQGRPLFESGPTAAAAVERTMRVAPLSKDAFAIKLEQPCPDGSAVPARVIGIVPGQCWSTSMLLDLPVMRQEVLPDLTQDVAKVAVVERHRGTSNLGLGFVKGFGLKRGAIASTVAHDAHNLMVLGTNDQDMLLAAQALISCQGGLAAVVEGQVMDTLPLPIAGIMSDQPMEWVANRLLRLQNLVAVELGVTASHPFMTLAFLALSVIPELKVTDRGYVDVGRFALVPVLAT